MADNLKIFSAGLGKIITTANLTEDEEDLEFLDKFMSIKLSEIPEFFTALIEAVPEELKDITYGELICRFLDEKLDYED